MVSQNNRVLKSNEIAKKTLHVEQGSISLEFTLRVDVKQELKDFITCLKGAQDWAEKQLVELSAKKTK